MSDPTARDVDLVLVGATGFVGRLTAHYLAEHAPAGLRIALAGRSAERLAGTRAGLPGPGPTWPVLTVDVLDETAVSELARRARVVVSTVGPYLRYGLPLVQACAAAGTHYADLTGETLFVRRSIAAAHEMARESGARIVHSCGFDSVPSDLGVGLAAARAADDGAALISAVLHVERLRAGVSGGTIDSLRQQVLEAQRDPEARRQTADPRALVDDVSGSEYGSSRTRRRDPPVKRDGSTGRWQAPFVMSAYNRQIVFRTNALTDWRYGREFAYHEVIDTGRGPGGAVLAATVSAGAGALMAGLAFGPTRALLDRVLPQPGQGPDERSRRRGRFRIAVEAIATNGTRYRTTIGADLDPGYGGTAVMLGESALSLACDADLGPAGVLTPMVSVGATLPDRLRAQGFTVDSSCSR